MKSIRVCVCGGRDFNDQEFVFKTLDHLLSKNNYNEVTLINGAMRGVDNLSSQWGFQYPDYVTIVEVPANWNKYGNAAGPLRNQKMIDLGFDLLIAFPGGSGTKDMKKRAKKACIPVYQAVYY
jgi:hypothetical protein